MGLAVGLVLFIFALLPVGMLLSRFGSIRPAIGPLALATLVGLLVASFVTSVRALFRHRDRSVAGTAAFILDCVVAAYWIVFFVGELVWPH